MNHKAVPSSGKKKKKCANKIAIKCIIYTQTHANTALHVWVWLPLCVPSAINELLRNEMRNEWQSETAITTTAAAKQRLFLLRVFLPTVCCCCWFIITPACNGKLQAMITTHKHTYTHTDGHVVTAK